MKRINQEDLEWEPASHEDPADQGVLKKVLVKHGDVDPKSKLMMINLAEVPVGKTYVAHSHDTMEEIFYSKKSSAYFTEGEGELEVNGEKSKVRAGDSIIVPAKQIHLIRNIGQNELKFIGIGIGIALD